jgi:hypothetical protein
MRNRNPYRGSPQMSASNKNGSEMAERASWIETSVRVRVYSGRKSFDNNPALAAGETT